MKIHDKDGESRSYWHYKRSKRYRRTIRIYNAIVAALIIGAVAILYYWPKELP